MPSFLPLLHDGAFAVGLATLLYTGNVTAAALTALLARTPARRRVAQTILKILLRPASGSKR